MKNHQLSKITGALIFAFGLSTSAFAAETSSAMRGKVLTPQGDAAANVKITVVHQPTGTTKELITNENGVFVAKGLRVGGPYRVVIDSDKYNDDLFENIYLSLGQTERLKSQLESKKMETIEVSGTRILQDVGGASSVFGEAAIRDMPSFNRDIKDVARLNPLVSINGSGEMTVAGGNPRSNSLSVDGIGQNDDFGLNFGGYPTQQPPVALDAIEQISVDVSPFSAKKGNFGGGTVNAVTKSGTNDFKFSGFYEQSSPELAGDSLVNSEVLYTETVVDANGDKHYPGQSFLDGTDHKTFEEKKVKPNKTVKRMGFNVGGPLIQDKLFYFVNYNNWKSTEDLEYGFADSGAVNEYKISEAQFNEFMGILNNTYGIEDSLGGDSEDTNETLLAKLSWNISDAHRLDFTYQWQDDQEARGEGQGGTSVQLASRRYTFATKFNNFSTKIYSDWSDDFSTEIGVSYKDVSSKSLTNSDLGSIKVVQERNGPSFNFGTDSKRHANAASTKNLVISFDATYLTDDHEIKFGAQYENLNLYNLFAEDSLGSWNFDSLEMFANKEIGSYDFNYGNAYTNNADDTAYDVTRSTFALYLEDTFYLTDDLEITAGIRYERLASDDTPQLNGNFFQTHNISNQENLDGLDVILPRVGFKYYATDDLVIRGGIGRFQGGIPNVWYNNPFTMDGITLVSAPNNVINDYYANNQVDITAVPQEIKDSLKPGAGSVNYIDPDFELPTSLRAQIGFDYTLDIPYLGEGFLWSSELMYQKKENEATWINTGIRDSGKTAADGVRVINESIYEDNFDIEMTNAPDDGRSIIFSTSLAKSWDSGVTMTMSYAHQDIEENHVGSASQGQGNYKHNIIKNRNQDMATRGFYEVEHSFKLNLGYTTEFFAGYATRFNMFFERRSGRPFSYTMGMYKDGDFGDTSDFYSQAAYLPYIPTGADDPNVNWDDSGLSWEQLKGILDEAGIAPSGSISDRNEATQPWVTTMDISIKQEIPGFAEGHSGEVYFMVENFANMLNSDWGVERKIRYANQKLYDFGGLDDQGRYKIDAVYGGRDTRNYSTITASAWQAKIGVSYKF
ncbi:TonB-dependent receptor [Pseudoalteromonas denitrificans]|uniref:Carboxypeptidase regulatory-like domain-containing protein n=1 Tax=Pseudoalteromonas denitrificans DSM 6059 TaxID=1123010 RepID=A0A1I1FSN3_9GAMM|nr:TonB-dependent receptor [Pseudoalteromonas denitrificans]SFC00083.1 Carboxypeptidase regulatory-like domain-containing protein [Pseudoalteromonas denitrificans DSM 6059]